MLETDPTVTSKLDLARDLSLRDGIAIVVGTVIGSGIFLAPGSVARQLPSFTAVMLVWVLGGILTLFGALSLAELGAAFPGAGGLYVYLRAAYGRAVAFLYGWGLLTLIHSGSIATLAVAFGLYLSQVVPMSLAAQRATAVLVIVLLTAMNYSGLRTGKRVQNIVTFCKVAGITLLIVLLFSAAKVQHSAPAAAASKSLPLAVGAALVAILWAYEGWHVVSFTAGEFKNPTRDLPKSLLWGALALALIYVLANSAYYAVLSPGQIQQTDQAAATAVTVAYGGPATVLVTTLILISILGATNGMILTGPRVYFAMARDGLFLKAFGRLDERSRVPRLAIVIQGIWASGLTMIGSFQDLFTYVIFTAWIFYGLSVLAVIVLRFKQPLLQRPFLVPAYPLIPVLFVFAALFIAGVTVVNGPLHALYGIALILAGLPVYWIAFRRESPGQSSGLDLE